jgi:hypothetical protein
MGLYFLFLNVAIPIMAFGLGYPAIAILSIILGTVSILAEAVGDSK